MPQAVSPSTDNYSILKGELYARKKGEIGWDHLGNVPEFTLTLNVETAEHFSSMAGVKSQDAEITTQVGGEVSLTLEEITSKNLARSLLGSTSQLTQAAQTDKVVLLEGVEVGKAYDIGYLNITADSVSADDGAETDPVAYTEGTNFELDYASGMLRVLAKPDGAGTDLEITFDAAAIGVADNLNVIAILKDTDQEISLMCIGKNEVGNKQKIEIPRVKLKPSGGIPFISDEFAQLPLTGKCLSDSTSSNYPFGKVTPLNGFAGA
ncbi:MAG TPA: hypothetical protein DCW68_06825 [Rhodospirillaceae bacterium]|nr:MAG: hypothetical protein A2018_01335 [Alphaproteobacteria bacterium GWF2_58_20]HAU29801.1 hypothetical protein [Rhodospirillaceae bacterium]